MLFVSTIPGNSLPFKNADAAVVEHESSFLIIGGYCEGCGGYSKSIYKYEVEGGRWIELPTTLNEGKSWMTAIEVEPSLIGTC